MTSPTDDLALGGPVVPQQSNDCQRCDPCTNGPDSPPDAVCPVVPQQPGVRECGCAPADICLLHSLLHLAVVDGDIVFITDILVRALFAVAGRVAAGAEPADAVAHVRERFGI